MIRELFQHNSGRVIAASRLALAILFGIWVWFDPEQPVRDAPLGRTLFGGYLLLSAALLIVSWKSWWHEFRLFFPAFLLDCLAFLTALYFTQSHDADLVSPFTTFFAFIVLTAAFRWQWPIALLASLVLSGAFLGLGFVLNSLGLDIDLVKFVRRASFLAMLAVLLAWFARERRQVLVARFELASPGLGESPPRQALAYAMEFLGGSGAALTWAGTEEPITRMHVADAAGHRIVNLAPGCCEPPDEGSATVFDMRKRRALSLEANDRLEAQKFAWDLNLVSCLHVEEGLFVPLQGHTGRGQLLVHGIIGMGSDHVMLASRVAREIARAFDEEEHDNAAREIGLAQIRSSIARDLHDSVAQTLAGTMFRLESIRGSFHPDDHARQELSSSCASLRDEQLHVRSVIERLRNQESWPSQRNLTEEAAELCVRLAKHWGIEVRAVCADAAYYAPAWLTHEIQQMVREAVANAVRHGSARYVELRVSSSARHLILIVSDNGRGFPNSSLPTLPKSLSERIDNLNGTLAVSSRRGETRVEISIPRKAGI